MKKILLLGAGRSATTLIQYLLEKCEEYQWNLTVGDISEQSAKDKIAGNPHGRAIQFNIHNEAQRVQEITRSDLVISMLPARFHYLAAQICVAYKKPFLTASYVSDDIKKLDWEAQKNGVILLMESGLDPGIDHMSGMRVLDQIKEANHSLTGFETFTGGLVAPESTLDNPWEYKFTWNPRNVVLAGQGIVKFIQEGRYKYIPYHRLFRRTELINIPGYGYFEGYANRDSLKYLNVYKLHGISTLYRGTLRRPGFSRAWNVFVQLGATDDTYQMTGVDDMTHRDFINSFLVFDPVNSVELKLAHYMNLDIDGEEMFKLKWLGIFDHEPIGLDSGTPAQILQHILQKKWKLAEGDKDMIVMWHKFDFMDGSQPRQIQSYMVLKGKTDGNTAMAQTVGLPLGIAAKLILTGEIKSKGVQIPVVPDIYNPILRDLEQYGIEFVEREIEMVSH
ncbi:MAG: saccharopine dehydrogenase NADP-binding domain-containing protein [Bacteroidia bacterium]|nr:saccharopine dehydrogenase NADP-binding domain-containing protein [Bacteroidia bacterium]